MIEIPPREQFGNGTPAIREIPPTTIEGRVTALERIVRELKEQINWLRREL
jgi:hypothetical protein